MLTRIHRAWLVAAVTFLVLIASAAFRSSVGLMIVPFEDDFGWSRSATSLAVSVNLVFYGLTAPFAAAPIMWEANTQPNTIAPRSIP